MTIRRYGKPSSSLRMQKSPLFKNSTPFIAEQRKIASFYRSQPKRKRCKICDTELSSDVDFIKTGIGYIFCRHCSHLNGAHDDTDDFCEFIYTQNSGADYAKAYKSKDVDDYNYRLSSIYFPKAEFLYTTFLEKNINPHDLTYYDFGAGSGYFVGALKNMGLKNVTGTEVSKAQVDYGNSMLGGEMLGTHKLENTYDVLRHTKAQVLSMIGVLEHLQNPMKVFKVIEENECIEYVYILVPMFSLSVLLEMSWPDAYHRQLQGGHTHLFTEESLRFFINLFGFETIGEWWFGADVVDLYRNISLALNDTNVSKKTNNMWVKKFSSLIDSMQLELDKKHYSSEVHMVLRRVK